MTKKHFLLQLFKGRIASLSAPRQGMPVPSMLLFVKCFDLDGTTSFSKFPLNVGQAELAGSGLRGRAVLRP